MTAAEPAEPLGLPRVNSLAADGSDRYARIRSSACPVSGGLIKGIVEGPP